MEPHRRAKSGPSAWLLASLVAGSLTGCDRIFPQGPEPKAPPQGHAVSAPDNDDTAAYVFDCDGPGPPVPRCPPKSGAACEALWKKVEAWRERCGSASAPEADPSREAQAP
jgi:hypothetical protein